jgi:hypothetical protein
MYVIVVAMWYCSMTQVLVMILIFKQCSGSVPCNSDVTCLSEYLNWKAEAVRRKNT